MPALLIRVLTWFATGLVAKLLFGAGLAFLSYSWINDLVLQAQVQMQGLMGNLPSDVLGVIAILRIDAALSIIMSAIGTAAFIRTSKVFLGRAS